MKRKTLVAVLLGLSGGASAAPKPIIRSVSDLPSTRFTFAQPPSAVMLTPAYLAMLPAMRREAERLLSDYDIQDAVIRTDLMLDLAAVAVLDGRKDDAVGYIAQYRAAQAKPQLQRLGGLSIDLAAVQLNVPVAQRCDTMAARVTATLAGADPLIVRDQVIGAVGQMQVMSPGFFAGLVAGQIDPVVKQRGSLDVLQALSLARYRVGATLLPPCRVEMTAAGRAWLNVPAHRAVDIWPARQPGAAALAGAKPVVVAVWDSGYDPTLFPGQLAADPAEPLDGRDNDGNGVADDWNGPTYDAYLRPRKGAIMPPSASLRARLAAQTAFDKGLLDLRFGFDTPEATLSAERARTASATDLTDDMLGSAENGGRTHGTACASEIADDAPFVRLYNVAALPWGRGEDRLDIPYDESTVARWVDAVRRIGVRMRGAGVRVVSMSWGLTADEITQQLLDRGLETDHARAKSRGLAMQAMMRAALFGLMKGAPDILFVIAAGNSDQPDDVQSDVTQNFALPNLVHVGATGTNGRPTSFTVFGKSVDLYAQGEAVKLRWPGDIVAHESGTSMAAPLVARAAAQMLAVQPRLSGGDVRGGLLASATMGDANLRLLDPAAAVTWAKSHR